MVMPRPATMNASVAALAEDTSRLLNRIERIGSPSPDRVDRGISPGARRPDGKARRPRIPAVFERGATPPAGMPRPGIMSRTTRSGHSWFVAGMILPASVFSYGPAIGQILIG